MLNNCAAHGAVKGAEGAHTLLRRAVQRPHHPPARSRRGRRWRWLPSAQHLHRCQPRHHGHAILPMARKFGQRCCRRFLPQVRAPFLAAGSFWAQTARPPRPRLPSGWRSCSALLLHVGAPCLPPPIAGVAASHRCIAIPHRPQKSASSISSLLKKPTLADHAIFMP